MLTKATSQVNHISYSQMPPYIVGVQHYVNINPQNDSLDDIELITFFGKILRHTMQ